MSAFHDNALIGASGQQGYNISRSVRLRSSASAYFNRTPASASNRKTWTWSGWVKRGTLNSSGAVAYPLFAINSANNDSSWFDVRFISDQLYIGAYTLNYRITNQVFRDPSAWYHIVIALDTTQATANDRLKLYVNGIQVTAFSTTNNPSQNADLGINLSAATYIGLTSGNYFDGYLTEINFIDGQALTPSSFGENDIITGVWKPKKYAGTYGNNGFYLNFSDNSAATAAAIGKDYSGNGNNWTPNNISVTSGVTYDSMIDVPTPYADGNSGRGNYPVINPLRSGASAYLSDGNLTLNPNGGDGYATIMLPTTGKWYFEAVPTNFWNTGAYNVWGAIGVITNGSTVATNFSGAFATSSTTNGGIYQNGTRITTKTTWASNDVIGIAVDRDGGTMSVYQNNTLVQSGITLPSGELCFYIYTFAANNTIKATFGQQPFTYTPPSGFKALNTFNLPDSTIKKGNQYFDVSTWTGDQTSRTITNSGAFQPDFIWTKSRSDAESHRLHDVVRGGNGSVLYELNSNETSAEGTDTLISGVASNGFTIASGANSPNVTGRTYVGWQWKKGATPGFDIVTGTSTGTTGTLTIAHSLGVAPSMVIAKNRDVADDWYSWHKDLGASSGGNVIRLNTTAAKFTSSNIWGTGHTSSNVLFGQGNWFTASNQKLLAYVFSEVAGFSRMGSFTGNGSSDGSFVYLGFRPRWILFKDTTNAATNWVLQDTSRFTYNLTAGGLLANTSASEYSTGYDVDILSNGFKIRRSGGDTNQSGATIIYAAFAENPFKNALAR